MLDGGRATYMYRRIVNSLKKCGLSFSGISSGLRTVCAGTFIWGKSIYFRKRFLKLPEGWEMRGNSAPAKKELNLPTSQRVLAKPEMGDVSYCRF